MEITASQVLTALSGLFGSIVAGRWIYLYYISNKIQLEDIVKSISNSGCNLDKKQECTIELKRKFFSFPNVYYFEYKTGDKSCDEYAGRFKIDRENKCVGYWWYKNKKRIAGRVLFQLAEDGKWLAGFYTKGSNSDGNLIPWAMFKENDDISRQRSLLWLENNLKKDLGK